jgi:outer membrane biosynthesis protein TonB
MLRKPLLSLFFAIALGGGFAYGLAHLFILRYEIGDVYPAYSSLRADPLGTKALADALAELPGVEVSRNFRPLERMRDKGPVTLFYAGVPRFAFWTESELAAFDSLVVGGSRAVFTFQPMDGPMTAKQEEREEKAEQEKKEKKVEEEKPASKKKAAKDKKKQDKKKDDKAKDSDEKKSGEDFMKGFVSFGSVAKRWGFDFAYQTDEKAPAPKQASSTDSSSTDSSSSTFSRQLVRHEYRQAALMEPGGKLEPEIPWHSALAFRNLKPQWKVLYMSGTMPVIIERQYGSGSIVLVADSFLVSNEALSKERHPLLLARLFSGPSKIVFDEESHGLRDSPGIASLARKYRLHGVVIGLILLAVFFVWKNAVRFIPAYEPQFAESDVIAGKESSEGFINLLRRSISPNAIFDTCVNEWRKTFSHNPRELAKAENAWAAEQARAPRDRNPIAAYRSLARALTHKK